MKSPKFSDGVAGMPSAALFAAYREAVADIDRSRSIAADTQAVWDVLADFGSISSWADNIDHSCILNQSSEPIEARNRWTDPDLHELRQQLRTQLKFARAETIPERNRPWPYASRRPS